MYMKLVNFALWGKMRAFKKQMTQKETIGFYYGPPKSNFKVNGRLFYMDSTKNSIEDLITCLEAILPLNKGYKHLVIYTEQPQHKLDRLLRMIWDNYYQKFYSVTIYINEKGEK